MSHDAVSTSRGGFPYPGFERHDRASPEQVGATAAHILASMPLLQQIMDVLPAAVMILNADRQIVFANAAMALLTGAASPQNLLGMRPGEAVGCIHARMCEGGCGASEFCLACGAGRAIFLAQRDEIVTEECRVTRGAGGEALDLRCVAAPLRLGDERLTLFVLTDISDEKRRRALERIFYHDVLNTAGSLANHADILASAPAQQIGHLAGRIRTLAHRLVEEINSQRQISAAESGDLTVHPADVSLRQVVRDIVAAYQFEDFARGRFIRVDASGGDTIVHTDGALLRRILGNMLRNALEAVGPDQVVTTGWTADDSAATLRVHNPGCMPRAVQLQIFKRSFSTKGPGRGLGTYSMKLLAEKYLGGAVRFTSTPEDGTTFYLRIPLRADPSGRRG